ncbi:MAG: hypothetical protein KDJ65_22855 [Anaerolineae bacterium]|nr:hypothetical protein [Anaerolineae bacterium]
MNFKILKLLCFVFLFVAFGCSQGQNLDPKTAQTMLTQSWSIPHHAVWEVEWSAVPLSAPLVVEIWRSGPRHRFEILEAPAADLVGQVFVFNGDQGWQYNRFDPAASLTPDVTAFSPITDAFATIDQLLAMSPQTATLTAEYINSEPAQKITLNFANGDSLALWRQVETELPIQIQFVTNGQKGVLKSRQITTFENDSQLSLFSVGDWIENVK